MTMIQNIRQSVHNYVDELDDDFLKAVHAMLETYTQDKESIASYNIQGNPKTVSELQAELAESLAAGKRGEGWTLEQLKKEQNFTGIDRTEFDALAKELDIQESYEEL